MPELAHKKLEAANDEGMIDNVGAHGLNNGLSAEKKVNNEMNAHIDIKIMQESQDINKFKDTPV